MQRVFVAVRNGLGGPILDIATIAETEEEALKAAQTIERFDHTVEPLSHVVPAYIMMDLPEPQQRFMLHQKPDGSIHVPPQAVSLKPCDCISPTMWIEQEEEEDEEEEEELDAAQQWVDNTGIDQEWVDMVVGPEVAQQTEEEEEDGPAPVPALFDEEPGAVSEVFQENTPRRRGRPSKRDKEKVRLQAMSESTLHSVAEKSWRLSPAQYQDRESLITAILTAQFGPERADWGVSGGGELEDQSIEYLMDMASKEGLTTEDVSYTKEELIAMIRASHGQVPF